MNSVRISAFGFLILIAIPIVFAHVEDAGETGVVERLHLEGYDITFFRSEKLQVSKDLQFDIEVVNPEGKPAEGMNVQGQILEPRLNKEIFYASVSEVSPARYAFGWKPSFAGDYVAQFVFRSAEDMILQPHSQSLNANFF